VDAPLKLFESAAIVSTFSIGVTSQWGAYQAANAVSANLRLT